MSTNSADSSRGPAPRRLLLTLTVPGRLPSLNALLGMQHWARHKLKQEIARDFLSALRVLGSDCSMKITSSPSIIRTYVDTLESFLRTRLESAKSKRTKGRPKKARKSTP